MSLKEIEAELDRMQPDELRNIALKSWNRFVEKENDGKGLNVCDENDPELLSALDEAVKQTDATPGNLSAAAVRAELQKWTTR